MNKTNKIAQFFENELNSAFQDVLIFRDSSGTIGLYGRYIIKPQTNGNFRTFVSMSDERPEFATLQNAVAWCTLHNANMIKDSTRLAYLDFKLSSLTTDLFIHRKLFKTAKDQEDKLLFTAKLQDDNHKRKQVINEILSFINSSRVIQARKFNQIKDQNLTKNDKYFTTRKN